MRQTFVTFCLLTGLSGLACAAPVITDVTGTLADGQSVTLTGTGFGAQGPSLRIYDNFEGGTAGADVDINATDGTWFGYGTKKPTFDTIAYSGAGSMRVHAGDETRDEHIIKASFPAATEFFVSYWLQLPAGSTFPGADIPEKIPTRAIYPDNAINLSTWKLVWIFDGDSVTNDNDIVLPTFVNGDIFLAGNNTREYDNRRIRLVNPVSTNFAQSDSIFRFGQWVRITVWMKAGAILSGIGDPASNGASGNSRYTFEIPTAGISQVRVSTDPVFTSDLAADRPPHQWTHMNFTGFFGNGVAASPDCNGATVGWCKTRPLFDDIYLATGPGAQARVEICDAPAHSDCVRFGYITVNNPTNWNDTGISGVIRKGALTDAEVERAFAYVYDKDGLVNATGFPLCPQCPLPPTNVQIE